MRFFRRNREQTSAKPVQDGYESNGHLSQQQIKRATRTRLDFGLFTAFCLFVAVIFLILVEIGNTSNRSVLRNIYFIRLDLTNVVPVTIPDATLLNSIAQTLGLHDFYQVGLWNYCDGYNNEGVTGCTEPQTLYWFNPVQIIQEQLIAGASIQLPSDINDILDIIQVASNWMFGLFLAGICVSFVLMFFLPCTVYSRWVAFLLTLLTFLNALMVTAAAIIATVMFVIMRNVFQGNQDVNIGAGIGHTMFALMWVAAGFTILAWLFQLGMCCCCASRRDVRTGRKKGSKKAYSRDSSTLEK